MEYNIYCDESCHLENDTHNVMVLGATWCSLVDKQNVFERLKEIKIKHNLDPNFEIKWNKISNTKLAFYVEIVNYFFDNDKLHFRALIINDKSSLEHEKYGQTHDDFYYKIYFDMLKVIINPENSYNIYLDIKDTRGYEKVQKLKDLINNVRYDFSQKIIKKIEEVRSEQISLLQITDLLIGALSYHARGLKTSTSKLYLIDLIKRRSRYDLTQSTLPSESKFNIFVWQTGFNRGGV